PTVGPPSRGWSYDGRAFPTPEVAEAAAQAEQATVEQKYQAQYEFCLDLARQDPDLRFLPPDTSYRIVEAADMWDAMRQAMRASSPELIALLRAVLAQESGTDSGIEIISNAGEVPDFARYFAGEQGDGSPNSPFEEPDLSGNDFDELRRQSDTE